ncbi:acyl-CoA dehydrogenase family protein [Saccharopolyspora gloriosae]|uniref:acyl-CoA dehydrogenase family protein n=1 Tax=Saccharopolyspora gloriosae TaxID=455344 RepID=UPI001FB799CF|nr:acyl-CoA dehydrogenase family protein [Saccharopolyspora gloriosae]
MLNGFDCTRPLLALTGIGCAQASLDDTAAYVRERSAFGSPLARFEGVSFPFEQRLRDVLALEIADGTARVQKIIVARELFGSVFVPYRSG